MPDYLKKILTARVYDVACETPLEAAPHLSRRTGNRVFLKREDMQSVFSFKLRGAYNKMAHLPPARLKNGVICASAGNHAQGVALAANRLGCRAIIAMPTTTPPVKIEAVKEHGGKNVEVVLYGDSFSDTCEHAMMLKKKHRLTFIHPFDDPDVIAGQGTIGMEILRQHPGPIHAVFVSIGGGGLIAGIAAYIKQVRPEIRVIGVETVDSNAMARSIKAGRRIVLPDVGLFSDGTAVKQVGKETFRLARKYVDEIVEVDTDDICAAIKDVFLDTRGILEPAGALTVAGIKAYASQRKKQGKPIKDETLVAVSSGANMNFDRLRFVAERADVGENREAVFAVTIPEKSGSFKQFCSLIGPRHVTEFNYRISDREKAHVFVGIEVKDREEAAQIAQNLEQHGLAAIDLTDNELSKLHIRYMVGGKSPLAKDEQLYRFDFPERPGALMRFLSCMQPNWNISLFHYRNHGADYGRVLVGFQVPKNERKAFRAFLTGTGYPFQDETANPVYQLFLGQ
ncbi:MAG: threonine ammonia-lyase, biosynthetic [Oxalobacter formigenes]|nr:threonine ammonia-lyase, biosynthetic [Oxalobacter formigenes]